MSFFLLQSTLPPLPNSGLQYEMSPKKLHQYTLNVHKVILQILQSQPSFIRKYSNINSVNIIEPKVNSQIFNNIISKPKLQSFNQETLSEHNLLKNPYITLTFQNNNMKKNQGNFNLQQTWQVYITKFAKINVKINFSNLFKLGLIKSPNQYQLSPVIALSKYLNLNMKLKLMTFKVLKNGQIILSSNVLYSLINLDNKEKLKKQIVSILKSYQRSAQKAEQLYAKMLSFGLNSQSKSISMKVKQSQAKKKINQLKEIFESLRKIKQKSTKFNQCLVFQKNKLKQLKNTSKLLCKNDFQKSLIQIGQIQYTKEVVLKCSTVASESAQKMDLQKDQKTVILSTQKQPYENQNTICSGMLFLQRIPGQLRFELDHTLGLSKVSIKKYMFNVFQTVNFPNKEFCIKNKKQSYLFNKTAISNKVESMNSIGNQIQFINFIRSQNCKYIGKYYLLMNDPTLSIYMMVYRLNLEYVLGQTQTKLKMVHKIQIALEIAKGIQHISCQNICHRDLKPGNVMLTEKLEVKLIDFGSAAFAYGQDNHNIPRLPLLSTPNYYQKYGELPKVLQYKFNKKQYYQHILFDSFSFGQIISQLFELQNYNAKHYETSNQIIQQLKWIKGKCKQLNPQDRLSSSMIVKMLEAIQQLLNQLQFFNAK